MEDTVLFFPGTGACHYAKPAFSMQQTPMCTRNMCFFAHFTMDRVHADLDVFRPALLVYDLALPEHAPGPGGDMGAAPETMGAGQRYSQLRTSFAPAFPSGMQLQWAGDPKCAQQILDGGMKLPHGVEGVLCYGDRAGVGCVVGA